MRLQGSGRTGGAVIACIAAAALSGCANNSATAPQGAAGGGGNSAVHSEPDTNGDGKVVIGVLSPGDINDHGYYESFVDAAEAYAKTKGWTVIKRGSVNPTEGLSAARALCQQHADLIALGASELRDAIPASEEPACAKTAWYVPSSDNVSQTPKIMLSTDDPNQEVLVAGYAAGLLMQARGDTKAAFLTGQEADFTKAAAKAFKAGIREVLPNASMTAVYTGDLNDSAKAKEAVQALISQRVEAVYPYLGGSTDAATSLANTKKLITLTPGTDRCASTSPKFDISVVFDPGDYLTEALKMFADGKLVMGTRKNWTLGVDAYPTVKFCNGSSAQSAKLKAFMADIGSKKIDVKAEVNRLGS